MDDEPMWAVDHVVALTLGFAITIPETANEFAIKGNHLTLVKGNQFDGRTKTDPHKHIQEFLRIYDMFKYKDTENETVRLRMFPLSLTGEEKTWLDVLNEGTIETWDELQTAFISNIIKIFYHGLSKITQEVLNAPAGGIFLYKTLNQAYQLLEDKVLLKLNWAKNQKTKSSLKKTVAFADEGSSNTDTDKIMARMDAMTIKMDAQYKELQSRAKQPIPDLNDDDIPMSHEEEAKFMETFDFDALLDEGSKILHSIKGTILEEEIFSDFDKFIAMTADENYDSESDTEEPPFEKITINTDYKIKTYLEKPLTDLKLKPLADNLEYVFLEEPSFLPVIIS
ncbi:hypothetical protein Tco_0701550 [Tanacetum coccineum]